VGRGDPAPSADPPERGYGDGDLSVRPRGILRGSEDLRTDVVAVSDTANAIIPYGKIEEALEGFLARMGLYNTIMERLAVLEKEAYMESFFSALSIAEALMEASL